jgi:hypothetical protein
VTDVVGAATLGLARKFIDPRILGSVDQAETYDESAGNLTGGWFDRNFEYNVRTVRDARLIGRLDEIHRDRARLHRGEFRMAYRRSRQVLS